MYYIKNLLLAFDSLDEMFANDLREEGQACSEALHRSEKMYICGCPRVAML